MSPPQSQTGGLRPVQVTAILVTMSSVTWPGTQNCRGSDADTCHVLLARDTRMFGHWGGREVKIVRLVR